MHSTIILGSGKIGRMIATLLLSSGRYNVAVADNNEESLSRIRKRLNIPTIKLDINDTELLKNTLKNYTSVLTALPYFLNMKVANAALEAGCNYFDLTEDVESTKAIKELAKKANDSQVFAPQCGLAPGFISIVASELCKKFSEIHSVKMRVGALPQFPTGQLKYNLTWSTDGLINEYCNPCESITNSKLTETIPLEGHEEFSLDGIRYEAFNTSGGLGTICHSLLGKAKEVNYKTIRYPGHRDLVFFLLNELKLKENRKDLKKTLESSIPITFQDVVIVFCAVSGIRNGSLVTISDARKVYSKKIQDEAWSAIQITTASAICATLDLVISGSINSTSFLQQEDIPLDVFLKNEFGKNYGQAVNTNNYNNIS